MSNVVSLPTEHHRLDDLKGQITAAYRRLETDWIAASLDLAVALRSAKALIPSHITFSGWLLANNINYFTGDDRGALVGLAGDVNLARSILIAASHKSYCRLWRDNKHKFPSNRFSPKNAPPKRKTKPRNTRGSPMTFRAMKLGDDNMAKIRGTSLDSAQEMDELIMLNRGAEPGTLTDLVSQLISDAASGKDVSALAVSAKLVNGRASSDAKALIPAWRKRMVHAWERADDKNQLGLILYLVTHSKWEDQEELLTQLLDQHHSTLKKEKET